MFDLFQLYIHIVYLLIGDIVSTMLHNLEIQSYNVLVMIS